MTLWNTGGAIGFERGSVILVLFININGLKRFLYFYNFSFNCNLLHWVMDFCNFFILLLVLFIFYMLLFRFSSFFFFFIYLYI